jgi:hypothetical protein
MWEEANRPGFYVATHYKGGSDKYTTPSTVTAFPNMREQFRIVFEFGPEKNEISRPRPDRV